MNEIALFLPILFLFGILLLFIVTRTLTRLKRGEGKRARGEGSRVEFVVETFQELVSNLKEKERELEELRKKAQERADAFESYNEYILQSVPSGVISLDGSLAVTKVNAAAEKILELKGREITGKHCTEVFHDPLLSLLRGNIVKDREEIPYTTNSGKRVHIGYTLTPLRGAGGDNIGQLLVFTDLTELKVLEHQAKLRDKLSSLGEMTAGMAHELRNPMAVIAGYIKMISKKADASMVHIVDAVSHEISVMDRIIGDFLVFAKPTDLVLSTVHLQDLIRNCAANVLKDRTGVCVNFGLDEIPAISGDEILLRQAFTNLIENSVDAMSHGGDLSFLGRSYGDHVEIAVSDTGHGIEEKMLDKIFLPFYTTKDKGTGLGLAIVHKIITSHRGLVTAESGRGGTTFRIRLPVTVKR